MKRNLHFYTLLFVLFISTQNIKAQAAGDYKTFASGSWGTAANWSRYSGTTWVNPAPAAPSSADGVITILSGHTMDISANISLDQTTIDQGGQVDITGSAVLTVANGTGTDTVSYTHLDVYKRQLQI